MLKDAIAKLQAEMAQNSNNSYIQAVGEMLLQHLEASPGSAEKILTQDKTIGKSLEEMRKVAEKKKVGHCAVLSDQEGFEVVLKYFGIKYGHAVLAVPLKKQEQKTVPEKPAVEFDVKLEDLL